MQRNYSTIQIVFGTKRPQHI